jgi:hypothetical protein
MFEQFFYVNFSFSAHKNSHYRWSCAYANENGGVFSNILNFVEHKDFDESHARLFEYFAYSWGERGEKEKLFIHLKEVSKLVSGRYACTWHT